MQLYVAVSNMFYFSPLFEEDFQFDYLIFFRWVETTNQIVLLIFFEVVFGQVRLTSYLNRMPVFWVVLGRQGQHGRNFKPWITTMPCDIAMLQLRLHFPKQIFWWRWPCTQDIKMMIVHFPRGEWRFCTVLSISAFGAWQFAWPKMFAGRWEHSTLPLKRSLQSINDNNYMHEYFFYIYNYKIIEIHKKEPWEPSTRTQSNCFPCRTFAKRMSKKL